MAIWHYSFHIIPKIKENFIVPKSKEGLQNDEALWTENPTPITFFDEIENILLPNTSWAN